jgi:hypothetical protein
MVEVHHDEGVANRIDPESCADAREGLGEALTGERIGPDDRMEVILTDITRRTGEPATWGSGQR